MPSSPITCSYILPLRAANSQGDTDLTTYLRWLAARVDLIVVDASAPDVFADHARAWRGFARHMPPAEDLVTPMGKVGNVLTGLRHASHEHVIIADDDVRYDHEALARMDEALAASDVVRPQNYFAPLPWHAAWDTGRTLLNRTWGGGTGRALWVCAARYSNVRTATTGARCSRTSNSSGPCAPLGAARACPSTCSSSAVRPRRPISGRNASGRPTTNLPARVAWSSSSRCCRRFSRSSTGTA